MILELSDIFATHAVVASKICCVGEHNAYVERHSFSSLPLFVLIQRVSLRYLSIYLRARHFSPVLSFPFGIASVSLMARSSPPRRTQRIEWRISRTDSGPSLLISVCFRRRISFLHSLSGRVRRKIVCHPAETRRPRFSKTRGVVRRQFFSPDYRAINIDEQSHFFL